MSPSKTISELIREYFSSHPNEDLEHGPVVDWVTEQWMRDHDQPPRDPWRAIRKLHEEGILIKVREGVYKYDPEQVQNNEFLPFDEKTKQAILERDDFKCVVCGKGREEGITLIVDHIKPIGLGGTNDIDNGETLCSQHNLMKKNYSQTEMGKKFIIKMYKLAVKNGDERIIRFCKAIFDVYDDFKVNGHIPRPNGN